MIYFKKLIVIIFLANTFAFGHNIQNKIGDKDKKHIVFLVSIDENNYEADKTIPEFAKFLEEDLGYRTTVLIGKGPRQGYQFTDLETILNADLLVVFCRRLALPVSQMTMIKHYVNLGKPIMGIRTANHAFHILKGEIEKGHSDWKNFVPSILGCLNKGYGPVEPGIDVSVEKTGSSHEIIANLAKHKWHSTANLYLVDMVDFDAQVLLTGRSDELEMPIAWVRETPGNGKLFYTSLGHPTDFEMPAFINLLTNGIKWTLNEMD